MTSKNKSNQNLAINAEKRQEELQQFGLRNAWNEIPAIVKTCTHNLVSKKLGRCYHEYRCDQCNFVYSIDSSD